MRVSDFDYTLPPELIAQQPVEPRDAARLLVLDRRGEHTPLEEHLHVRDLPDLLRAGDLLVANRSRVLPARVLGRLAGGGRAEFLLLRQHEPGQWEALARPARRLRPGDVVTVTRDLAVEQSGRLGDGLLRAENPGRGLRASGAGAATRDLPVHLNHVIAAVVEPDQPDLVLRSVREASKGLAAGVGPLR